MICILLSLDILVPRISEILLKALMIYGGIKLWKASILLLLFAHYLFMPNEDTHYKRGADRSVYGTITKLINDSINKLDMWSSHWCVKRKYDKPPWAARRRRKRRFITMAAIIAMSGTTDAQKSEAECGPFDSDSAMVGIDNRCSGCITHVRTDIPGELTPCNRVIKGFGGTRTTNVWQGTIHWSWDDDQGQTHKMVIPNAYYVPEGKVRLLSPQHWAQTRRKSKDKRSGTGEETTGNRIRLFWDDRKFCRTVPLDKESNNVATFRLSPGYQHFAAYCAETGMDPDEYDNNPITVDEVVHETNNEPIRFPEGVAQPEGDDETWPANEDKCEPREFDLNGPDVDDDVDLPKIIPDEEDRLPETLSAELLRLHYDFGHVSFKRLQEMAKQGIIPKKLAKCSIPLCSACQYAKATKRPWRPRTSKNHVSDTEPPQPGKVVSVDQMVSPTPGLIAQMTGFMTKQRYRYTTVYVDSTGFGFTYHQRTASAKETLESKEAFERYAAARGITIQAYHADNGIFKAREWVEACEAKGQALTFAAVGAHHQNGKAEKGIRDRQDLARTMLLHAAKRWPKAITASLWPYAIRQANDCLNATPNMQHPQKLSPLQVFHNTSVNINSKHWKPFGCPVYVLDQALQSGTPFHKWKPRARLGVYLGQSPIHNRNVALVLNLNTGHVSPQFHVKFDKGFHTLSQESPESTWQVSAFFEAPRRITKTKKRTLSDSNEAPHEPLTDPEVFGTPRVEVPPTEPPAQTHQNVNPADTAAGSKEHSMRDLDGEPHAHDEKVDTPHLRRSARVKKPPDRLVYAMLSEADEVARIPGELLSLTTLFPHDTQADIANPILAYKAAVSDPDTMYHHQARKEKDWPEFQKAMQKEVDDQLKENNFTIVHRSKVPQSKSVLPAVWALKRKRDPGTGKVTKWKARLNIDGSRMKRGVHYDQTYSPVASWTSIRLVLAMAATFNWHTVQLDYVAAYTQAPVEREIYMEVPRGFEVDGNRPSNEYVFKLNANTYGQKQAGRVWFKHLSQRLIKHAGFKQSKVDECIFYRGSVIYVLYTDDSILTGPNKDEIDQAIEAIKKAKLKITVEGEVTSFLGVKIDRFKDGSIKFSQPMLIDKILKALRLGEDTKTLAVPAASSRILHRHVESEPFDEAFDYRSVIGMIMYLNSGSRSDIAYATHQCARFSSCPKAEHGKAVRWIGRYLAGTRNEGTTFKPDTTAGLEVFVDADFSGNWNKSSPAQDRDTARSRHGYIIRYMGCPIVWKSQLQTEIALSSTESEYTGLSYALRETIPIMELLNEMHKHGFPVIKEKARVHCRVFEDNSGAIEMARVHKFRPLTKHINVKLHHFRDYVERGEITILPIPSKDQLADYLTKPLEEDSLRHLRQLVMGW